MLFKIQETDPGAALNSAFRMEIQDSSGNAGVFTGPVEDVWKIRKEIDRFLMDSPRLDDLSAGIILQPGIRDRVVMLLDSLRGTSEEGDDTPEQYVRRLIAKDLEERLGMPL